MKKVIFLIILVICLSGCSVDYNLTINSMQDIEESFDIKALVTPDYPKEYLYGEYIAEYPTFIDQEFIYYEPQSKIEEYSYYDKKYQELDDGYIFNYQAKYNLNNLNRARSINTAFANKNIGYIQSENYYYIAVANPTIFNNFPELEKITININFNDYEVIENNATTHNNNTYTWVINNTDKDASINIKYRLKQNNNSPQNNNNSNSNNNPNTNSNNNIENKEEQEEKNTILEYIIIGALLLIFVIIIIGLIKYKSVKENK